MELQELKEKIIYNLDNTLQDSLLGQLKYNALTSKMNELKKIETELSIKKHKLVFIGTIGSGKTTALCYLFDLLLDKDSKTELLVTGAGGSTICEVHIELTKENNSYITTEFVTKQEMEYYIDDFADYIYSRVNPEDKKIGASLSQEIMRALRNILGLKRSEKEDLAIQKIKEFKNLEKFKEFLIGKIENINFEPNKIEYKSLLYDNQKEFIKDSFAKINSAAIKDYSIPTKITLSLNEKIFGTSEIWKKYDEIIDTKGLDGAFGRQDIDGYLESPENVLVFTSKFSDAPDANIMYQLEKYYNKLVTPKSLYNKAMMMVLPRGKEPKEKVGSEGNYNLGQTLALDFIEHRVSGKIERIQFFNAKRNEDFNKRDNIILSFIEMSQYLISKDESSRIDDEINAVLNVKTISLQAKSSLVSALKKINISESNYDFKFNSEFVTAYDKWYPHWNTKHAINKRKGVFREYNIFYLGSGLVLELYSKNLELEINNINSVIDDIDLSIQPLIKSIDSYMLNESLGSMILSISQNLLRRLENHEFSENNNEFWNSLVNEEIRGPGYVERVKEKYYQQLKELDNYLVFAITEIWDIFITEILDALGYNHLINEVQQTDYELREFTIKQFQGIKNIESVRIPENTKCIFFTGENGYGKTSILRGIVAGLLGGKDNRQILANTDDSKISVTYYSNTVEKINDLSKNENPFIHLAAYGANRGGIGDLKKMSKSYHIFNDDGQFINIENELIRWESNDKQRIYFTTIRNRLLDFLSPYIDDIRVRREDLNAFVEYREKGKDFYIDYSKLATGFKSVIGLVGDIIWRLSQNNFENIKGVNGIVIIDEFDLHLHPIWQKNILIKLNKVFPKVQFILSTHSPIPLLGAPSNSIVIKVDRDSDANIVANVMDEIDFSNLQPNAILTSPVFNFDSLIPHSHKGDEFIETESYYNNIVKNNQIKNDVNNYLNDKRTQEILTLIDNDKLSNNEES